MKEIVYAENDTPKNNLPMYVTLDFGDTYTGNYFFGDDLEKHRWVPKKTNSGRFFCISYKLVRKSYLYSDFLETFLGVNYMEITGEYF